MNLVAAVALICGAFYVIQRKRRKPRPEDGHDRAARREDDWYSWSR
jgi:hypothetical protein